MFLIHPDDGWRELFSADREILECWKNPATIPLMKMDANPYQAPESELKLEAPRSSRDRDQCPSCRHRQPIWNAINVVGKYRCPNCSKILYVRLPRPYSTLSFCTALAIGVPGLLLNYFLYSTDPGLITIYSTVATFLLIALGTFYFPWRFGYLDKQ